MTVTDEAQEVSVETEAPEAPETETKEKGKPGRKRDTDFTKVRPYHEELAAWINERSQIDPVSPNQVKAVLTLRTAYANTDEAKAAREERKRQIEAEKSKYAGMSDEQIKAAKAADRQQKQADKLAKRAQEAIEKAAALRAQASGSGEDLAAVVESQQSEPAQSESVQAENEAEETPKRRGLGRRR